MPKFGKRSKANLEQAHPELQRLFREIIKHWDCAILEAHRSAARQEKMFDTGKSKLHYPASRHNADPSLAVDVAPYPIDWGDTERFYAFGGFVLGIASQMGIPIRWGGDWDSDREFRDQSFHDLPHFELTGPDYRWPPTSLTGRIA